MGIRNHKIKSFVWMMLASVILILSAGCEREPSGLASGEGETVTIDLNIDVCSPGSVSVKSWESNTDNEREIRDLRVYIFDGSEDDGELIGFKQYGTVDLPEEEEDGYTNETTVSVTTKAGLAYIYAIANASTSQYWVDDENSILNINETSYSQSDLTRKTFLGSVFERQAGALSPMDDRYLMTGYANNGRTVKISLYNAKRKSARIEDPDGINKNAEAATIRLYKIISKNTLTITTGDDITFTPKHYVLKNVPTHGALIPGADADLSGCTYEEMNRVVMNSSSVSFYLPENLQSANIASGATFSKWADRETNSYENNKKSFTNAPENATYIEISGSYLEGSTYSGEVTYTIHFGDFGSSSTDSGLDNFDVTRNYSYVYTLTINGINDFIAEAKVEGEDDDDDDPGSEGVVITPSGAHYRVDSHYEARVLKFTKSEILSQIQDGMGYIMKIDSPFTETKNLIVAGEGSLTKTVDGSSLKMSWPAGVYSASKFKDEYDRLSADTDLENNSGVLLSKFKSTDGITTTGANIELETPENLIVSGSSKTEQDWYWLHYVLNTGETTSAFGGSTDIGCLVDSDHDVTDVCRYPGDGRTMDIFTFLYKMYEAAIADDDSDVSKAFFSQTDANGNACAYVTCFIDENYYSDRKWNEYCNQVDDRMAYIATELDISADGKSTFANAKYVMSQCSIWTVYPTTTTTIAFGTEKNSEENIQEPAVTLTYSDVKSDGKYDNTTYTENKDDFKGWTTAIQTDGEVKCIGTKWYDKNYLDGCHSLINGNGSNTSTEEVACQDFYSDVFLACMSRNRDADGDGVIDKDEVKWYLASEVQYTLLWLGEGVLPSEALLFSPKDANWDELSTTYSANGKKNWSLRNWHYYTSSKQCIFWAEEGANLGDRVKLNGNTMATKIRCVRTLENNGEGLTDPDHPINCVDITNRIIEVDINEDALRPYQSSSLAPSLERGNNSDNLLYKKFQYAEANLKDDAGDYVTYDYVKDSREILYGDYETDGTFVFNSASDDICSKSLGTGWRVPNQRELMAMAEAIDMTELTPQKAYHEFLWSSTYYTGLTSGYYRFDEAFQLSTGTDASGNEYKYVDASAVVVSGMIAWTRSANNPTESFGIQLPNYNNYTRKGYVRCVRDVQ